MVEQRKRVALGSLGDSGDSDDHRSLGNILGFIKGGPANIQFFTLCFGSWAIVSSVHFVSRYAANGEMKDRVLNGRASGTMSRSERMVLAIESLVKTFVLAAIPAMFWLLTGSYKSLFHHLLTALPVITIPALFGIDGEIKRWLKGIEELAAAKPDMHWSAIVRKLDRFQLTDSSTYSE